MAGHLISRWRRIAPPAAALGLWLGVALPSAQALGPKAPFQPPVAPSAATIGSVDGAASAAPVHEGVTGLRLRHHPMALIDGQWARVGDSVRGARLESIRATGALLRHANGRIELLPWNAMPDAEPKLVRTSTP